MYVTRESALVKPHEKYSKDKMRKSTKDVFLLALLNRFIARRDPHFSRIKPES